MAKTRSNRENPRQPQPSRERHEAPEDSGIPENNPPSEGAIARVAEFVASHPGLCEKIVKHMKGKDKVESSRHRHSRSSSSSEDEPSGGYPKKEKGSGRKAKSKEGV